MRTPSPGPTPDAHEVARARALLAGARRLVVFTGAGVSAESGVPTFRGAGGLWQGFRAEELASPVGFARDPRLVWEWYAWRRALVAGCAPNAAHLSIARRAAAHPRTTVVTQNVDGLHQQAAAIVAAGRVGGTAAQPVIALHGQLFETRCTRCDYRLDPAGGPVEVDATSRETLPRCPWCGALLRPGVVWFGEPLAAEDLDAAFTAAAEADACLVVGTSAVVQPAARVATIAAHAGAALVEVNAEETPLSPLATVSLRGAAAALVPALLDADAGAAADDASAAG